MLFFTTVILFSAVRDTHCKTSESAEDNIWTCANQVLSVG